MTELRGDNEMGGEQEEGWPRAPKEETSPMGAFRVTLCALGPHRASVGLAEVPTCSGC